MTRFPTGDEKGVDVLQAASKGDNKTMQQWDAAPAPAACCCCLMKLRDARV